MATTQQDKPSAKQRQRARKTEQKGERRERQAAPKANQAVQVNQINQDQMADVTVAIEKTIDAAGETALRGEVLPPESHAIEVARQPMAFGLQAIAAAYADYARNSWAARKVLVDRVMTTRSLGEAMEVQGDFAKEAYANFVTHSQKIGELYAEYTRQFFRPLENLAHGWTRVSR